jgi:MEMO1 family protein
MRLRLTWVVMLLLAAATVVGMGNMVVRVRHPAVAGLWYPSDPAELYAAVRQYMDDAGTQPRERLLVAGVVPDAGYAFSGAVAGHFHKLLQTGQYDRVIVMTPSHRATFRGCSVPSVQIYRTPLGDIWLDGPTIRQLIRSPLIVPRSVQYRDEAPSQGRVHEFEHGVEVQLPFLQVQLGEHKLIPLVVGDMKNLSGKIDHPAIESVAKALRGVMDDRTLLVVSTTFTQHGYEHGYMPFTSDVEKNINALDARAFDHLMNLDYGGFMGYLEETGNYMTGWVPMAILIKTLKPSVRGVLLDYDTSRSKATDPSRSSSVSYGALAFFDMNAPPAEQRPVRTLFSNPAGEPDPAVGQADPEPVPGDEPPPDPEPGAAE